MIFRQFFAKSYVLILGEYLKNLSEKIRGRIFLVYGWFNDINYWAKILQIFPKFKTLKIFMKNWAYLSSWKQFVIFFFYKIEKLKKVSFAHFFVLFYLCLWHFSRFFFFSRKVCKFVKANNSFLKTFTQIINFFKENLEIFCKFFFFAKLSQIWSQ